MKRVHSHFFRLGWVLLVIALLAACSPAGEPAETAPAGQRLPVAATTTIAADVVRQVGGEAVEVSTLLPVGSDPHSFQPAPQDIARLSEARLIFAAGAGLEEGFLSRLVENAGAAQRLVELSEGIELKDFNVGEEEEQHAGEGDPHVWFDPNNVKVWAQNAAAALAAADPEHAGEYRQRADAYITELEALDSWIAGQLDAIPAERRVLVSDHSLLGYFAERYGFELVGAIVPSYSSASAPSAQELAALEDAIKASGAVVVVTGNTVNPDLARQVANDTGAQLVPLYTDSLTPPEGPAGNYLNYMRANVNALVEALR